MTLSGFVLYLAPPGRIANWSNWKYIGLLKSEWQAVHTIFTFIFVAAIGFHLYFNWRSILAYLKTKIDAKTKPRKEIFFATLLSILVFALTLNNSVPFSSVMNFGESLKESWSAQTDEPPIPHAEEQSLTKFAQTINFPKDKLVNSLKDKGIKVESETRTIKEISALNNITPNELYKIVSETSGKHLPAQTQGGRGYGRKTIAQLCGEFNLTENEGVNRLKTAGLLVEKDDKLKDVASRYNLTPIDIANIITGTNN